MIVNELSPSGVKAAKINVAAKVGIELGKVINKHHVTKVWNERESLAMLEDTKVYGSAKRSHSSDIEQVESVLYVLIVTIHEKKGHDK